ncbi:MAG TPA: ferritin-like protein [Acidimicrobiia bacterium]|jgi:rubrerythrin|nr:ferritin-like protein [Acidimicrobiia bacterium]
MPFMRLAWAWVDLPDFARDRRGIVPIETPEQLKEHLALAIEVELTTVPPYLFAMYSLADQDAPAAQLIRSVVTEEMLHAALIGNLLLAVGGEPRFAETVQSIRYPRALPHHIPELIVDLEPCSHELIERVFLTIERPELHDAPPEPDEYQSLGQFYHALELAIERLAAEGDLFRDPQVDRQLSDPASYAPVAFDSETSGGLIAVTDLASACRAIETVIHQGEGVSEDRFADAEHRELTHYAKFLELADGTIPLGEIKAVMRSPTASSFPDFVRPVAALANALYGFTFELLDRLYGSSPAGPATVGDLYRSMALLGEVSRYLMSLEADGGEVAGPPFRATAFADPAGAASEVRRAAAAAGREHPALRSVLSELEALG